MLVQRMACVVDTLLAPEGSTLALTDGKGVKRDREEQDATADGAKRRRTEGDEAAQDASSSSGHKGLVRIGDGNNAGRGDGRDVVLGNGEDAGECEEGDTGKGDGEDAVTGDGKDAGKGGDGKDAGKGDDGTDTRKGGDGTDTGDPKKKKKQKTPLQELEIAARVQINRYNGSTGASRNLLLSVEKDAAWAWAKPGSQPLQDAVAEMDKFLLESKVVITATTDGIAQVKKDRRDCRLPKQSEAQIGNSLTDHARRVFTSLGPH